LKTKPFSNALRDSSAVGGNLTPARKFIMARIRIVITQVRTQHRVKTELHDKETRRQQIKRSLSCSMT